MEDLMGQTRRVELSHQGKIYILRITRNEKLILTR